MSFGVYSCIVKGVLTHAALANDIGCLSCLALPLEEVQCCLAVEAEHKCLSRPRSRSPMLKEVKLFHIAPSTTYLYKCTLCKPVEI